MRERQIVNIYMPFVIGCEWNLLCNFGTGRIQAQAEVAKLADALRSGRSGFYIRVGSNPTFGMKTSNRGLFLFLVIASRWIWFVHIFTQVLRIIDFWMGNHLISWNLPCLYTRSWPVLCFLGQATSRWWVIPFFGTPDRLWEILHNRYNSRWRDLKIKHLKGIMDEHIHS